jgi:molecular chaperone DnaK (HSP70)
MLSDKDKKKIKDVTDDLDKWIKNNPNASEKDIEDKKKEVEKQLEPIIKKAKKRKDFSEFVGIKIIK